MANIIRPNVILNDLNEFDVDEYQTKGFNLVLIDADNTVVPYGSLTPSKEGLSFINKLKKANFKIVVISNNTKRRVSQIAKGIDADYICWALKPLPFKYKRAIKKYGEDTSKTLFIGDQLFTDILGANLSGIYSIYIKNTKHKDIFYVKIMRVLERFTFKHILHEEM